MSGVPAIRVSVRNAAPLRPERDYVLYWMIAARRAGYNFGLERAVEHARALGKPLVVLEPLDCGERWSSARAHRFVLDGMAEQSRLLAGRGVLYHPYAEPERGASRGLLRTLAARAVAVVTDDSPAHFLPRLVAAAARRLDVRLEAVDSNGLLPLGAAERAFPTAFAFRRHLQRTLPEHLDQPPSADPLRGARLPPPAALPAAVARRWPAASPALLAGDARALGRIPVDHGVPAVARRGGSRAARRALDEFLARKLADYADWRNDPDRDVASGLSPYLHFGQLSVHEIFAALARHEGWSPADLGRASSGRRTGWWGMSASAEAFLDELVTWRELGYVFAALRPDHDRWESLPDWARRTLAAHGGDRREHAYGLDDLAAARTHDPLWNAAQNQLRLEGRIHNYLRMLWGKKILEWSASPEAALEALIELNNRWALDGRDPNSYTGIFWVLGRHDRPWAPERPIFGFVRYMSSENTARKLRVREYVRRFGAAEPRA